MSLIVFSGTVDKLMAASILTTGAAAMGLEVEVFLTTWGLEAFRKDNYKSLFVKETTSQRDEIDLGYENNPYLSNRSD